MITGELMPIVTGVVLGAAAALTVPEHRRRLMATVVPLAAVVAATTSGEYQISWSYFLVDALIVLAVTCVSFVFAMRVGWAR
jgi:hypothetical protein